MSELRPSLSWVGLSYFDEIGLTLTLDPIPSPKPNPNPYPKPNPNPNPNPKPKSRKGIPRSQAYMASIPEVCWDLESTHSPVTHSAPPRGIPITSSDAQAMPHFQTGCKEFIACSLHSYFI